MKVGGIMCKQKDVLRKIHKKGKVNGYDVELADAQAEDYVSMKKEIADIKANVDTIKIEQAVQGKEIKLILERLNGPLEKEREAGIFWLALKSCFQSWKGWCFIIFFIFCVALAGQRVMEFLHWIPTGV